MPEDEQCPHKESLLRRCDLARALYIQAARHVGEVSHGGFDSAYVESGKARIAYDTAKDTLEAHTKEHGC